jgi:hypothetical protein
MISWQIVTLVGIGVFAWALREVLKAIPNANATKAIKKAADDANNAREIATKLSDRVTVLEMRR